MFLQKIDILINKQARPHTNLNDEVTKIASSDDITRFDGMGGGGGGGGSGPCTASSWHS
jgi:hypothetical protein